MKNTESGEKEKKREKGQERRRYGGRGVKEERKRDRGEKEKKTQISQWNFIMWLPNRS